MKSIIYSLSILLFSLTLNAQVGVGTTTPEAALDIESTNNGLLIPRVALTSTTDTTTIITATESELVYNTATVADVTPGFYYLITAAGPWVRFGGATGWLTTGNADIVNGTNFLGTTTDVDIAFRRNNLAAGKISVNSTSFGIGALNNGSNSNSVAFGNNALNVSTGQQNVAFGANTLSNNTTGGSNVAIGFQALQVNGNSLNNTAIGHRAMASLNGSAWQSNVAIGWGAMADVTTQVTNSTFVGVEAGRNNRGIGAVGLGRRALGSNNGGPSTGEYNTAVGHEALAFNTSGQHNTAIGSQAMAVNTVGFENTSIGYRSGFSLSGGDQNSFLGYSAGSDVSSGNTNIAIGYQAQVPSSTASNQLSIGNWIYGNSGNIGIGISVPNEKFEVNGKIKATNLDVTGNIGIGVVSPTDKLEVNGKIRAVDVNFSGLPIFDNEAAAILGGIASGDLYQTTTGEIRIKL